MVAGAAAISLAEATDEERAQWKRAMERESRRYGLDLAVLDASLEGEEALTQSGPTRSAWDWLVAAAAVAIFAWAAMYARPQPVAIDVKWMAVLASATVAALAGGGWLLWRRTRFS